MRKIPLNIPHAGNLAVRFLYHLQRRSAPKDVCEKALRLAEMLDPYRASDSNPPDSNRLVATASQIVRGLVEEIERLKIGDDRLGQTVRNLFECLDLAEEGARLSLRAGENPGSALRP